jgi:PAS domain S-box-containing protein
LSANRESTEGTRPSAPTIEAQSSRPGILIVEDERVVALDMAETLRELGYAVCGIAARGEDAIERAKALEPALVLMDVRLAGKLDGIQTAEAIREHRDVPVIYLTAHSDDETLHRAANTLASGYLVKPFKSPELHCAIEIALHKHAIDSRLRENEQWLVTTLRSITDAVIATDADGRVRLLNPIAEALTGWSQDEAMDHAVDDILPLIDERTGTRLDNPLRDALAVGTQQSVPDTAALVSREGHRISIEECAAPIVDRYGKIVGGVVVLRDVSEQRRQHDQITRLNQELEQRVIERTAALEQANQELEAFSYSVAHDLRAPLRGIDSFSQLLEQQHAAKLDAEALGYLGRVRASASRMSQLIDALLSLSRVGRSELQARTIDLTVLVQSIVPEIEAAHPDHHVHITIAPGMRVFADPRLLRVAMCNLLDNAWKFTSKHPHPQVEVGTIPGNEGVTGFVRDNGAGFDPAYAGRLFGAFQRLHSEREYVGTGVGLAIVQRVIARHGGRVWATSKPDQGATFNFLLPRPL